jgi:hypothetical protein
MAAIDDPGHARRIPTTAFSSFRAVPGSTPDGPQPQKTWDLAYPMLMKKIRSLRDLKKLGATPVELAFARKYPSLAEAWDACERADWMMCVLYFGEMLDKPTSLRLATVFAQRTPTRMSSRWVARVAAAGCNSDAAGDAWAASYSSAHRVVYSTSPDFDESIFEAEMRWQAAQIRQIVGNPFGNIQ